MQSNPLLGIIETVHIDQVDPNRLTYRDPLTGTEVKRLAMHHARCIQPYFTNQSFTNGMKSFIYTAEDDEHHFEIYRVDPDQGPASRLTWSEKPTGPEWSYPCASFTGVNWSSVTVAPKTDRVYYYVGFRLFMLDLETQRPTVIYEIPADRTPAIPHLSADEDLLLVPTTDRKIENIPDGPTRQRDVHDLVKRDKLTSDITIVKTDGSGAQKVLEENSWITHVQFSPTDSNLILYCHEGIWQQVEQRIWLLDLRKGTSRRTRDQRGTNLQIGHELWLDDGRQILYHGWDGKKEDPKAGWSMAGIIDISTDRYVEWKFPDGTFYGHFYSWGHGDYLITDGVWDHELLYLIDARRDGTWTKRPICRVDSSWKRQELHPHPRVSPDGQWVVFNSDRDGKPGIYMARLPELK